MHLSKAWRQISSGLNPWIFALMGMRNGTFYSALNRFFGMTKLLSQASF
jgi:hypothetical protein